MHNATLPTEIFVSLSALLTAYEASDTDFLCKTLTDITEACHKSLYPNEEQKWIRPLLDGSQTYAALLAAMPNHIRPYYAGQCLENWVQWMPLRVRLARLWGVRAFRLSFLRWAISKYNNPILTLKLG